MREFQAFAAELLLSPGELLDVDDFNLYVDDVADSSARQFLDVLDTLELRQHVTETTHKRGHTLDPVITRKEDSIVPQGSLWVDPLGPSYSLDHFPVYRLCGESGM